MGKCFEDNSLNVPEGSKIPGMDVELPHFLVGNEVFPLKTWLIRPYPGTLDETQRIYNYTVSRARRTIENVFGILVARWCIFRKAIRADIKTVEAIVDSEMEDGSICPGDWRHLIPNVVFVVYLKPKAEDSKPMQKIPKELLRIT